MLLDRMQRFQAARARKPQVEQHGVSTRAVEQPVGMFGRLRHLRVESKRQRHLAAGLADSAVVVHDQEVQEIRSLELRRMAMALTMTKDGGGRCGKHGGSPGGKMMFRIRAFLCDAVSSKSTVPLGAGLLASRLQNFNHTFDQGLSGKWLANQLNPPPPA